MKMVKARKFEHNEEEEYELGVLPHLCLVLRYEVVGECYCVYDVWTVSNLH